MNTGQQWIRRGEALQRLGVKTQTLYAYVSRGRIAARPDPADPRRSLYAAEDIVRLSGPRAEGEPVTRPSAIAPFPRGDILIPSSLSLAVDGRLFYRGLDAAQLSQSATVEDVARLLWDARDANPFAGLGPRLDGVTGSNARMRLFNAVARRAHEDETSTGREPEALRLEAASILNEAVDAIAGPGPRLHFHQRLGRVWKILERDAPLLRVALVLAADDPSDAGAVATRIAGSGGSSLAGAALAGLTTVSGSVEQARRVKTIAYVQEARRDPVGTAHRWTEARDGSDFDLPGFGSDDWPDGDPRANALLTAADLSDELAAVAREGEAATGCKPTFGLALALVARRLDLPRDAAADLMLIGRLTGLLGHALDQAIHGSPIAARLRYVGPAPGAH